MKITVEVPLESGELLDEALDRAREAHTESGPEFAEESWPAQQADALVAMARDDLSGNGDASAGALEHYQVTVHEVAGMKSKTTGTFLRAMIGIGVSVSACSGQEHGPLAPNHMFPQWSHDGKRIVFTSDRDNDPEIYVVNADGSNPLRLTYAPGRDAHPFFSRDGRRIVFQSPRANGEDTNIYVMKSDGSHVVPLTNLKGFAGVPVYSPDESLIAFQWRETDNFDDDRKWRLCIMNADGSGLRAITTGEANDQVPNWSRDGERLIFYSDRSGKNQIYTMKADGSDVRLLVATESNDNAASWSPDNTRIAFTSDRDGNSDIYVMDANGRNVRRLTNSAATERAAAWSPDGNRIVFSSDGDGPSAIHIMNADGSNLQRLRLKADFGDF